MGLQCTYNNHDIWSVSYSVFNRWRSEIARAAGFDSDPDDDDAWRNAMPDHDDIMARIRAGHWGPEDPVLILLMHSDCEGSIMPKDAAALAGRLDGMSATIGTEWKAMTSRFIAGLRDASAAGATLMFC